MRFIYLCSTALNRARYGDEVVTYQVPGGRAKAGLAANRSESNKSRFFIDSIAEVFDYSSWLSILAFRA